MRSPRKECSWREERNRDVIQGHYIIGIWGTAEEPLKRTEKKNWLGL
jgi:hypothetical protein